MEKAAPSSGLCGIVVDYCWVSSGTHFRYFGFSHAEAPYCSPLASRASVWLSSQTAEEAGLSRTSTCGTATHHDRVYADQAEPAQTVVLHYKEARSCTLAAASSQTPLPSVTRSITIESFAGSAVPVRSRKLASYQDFKKNARLLSMPASLISCSLIPCLTDRCLCIFGSISSSTELIGRKIFNLFVQENKKMNQ